ncbi:MAG TPA: hypothetical protein VF533_13030 [Solirubrobacteraceae bacterium]
MAIERIEPETYPRAAIRWVGKLCADNRVAVGLDDVARIAAALDELPRRPQRATAVLAEVCTRAGLLDAARVFGAWRAARPGALRAPL